VLGGSSGGICACDEEKLSEVFSTPIGVISLVPFSIQVVFEVTKLTKQKLGKVSTDEDNG
jgi:hypothetical protein